MSAQDTPAPKPKFRCDAHEDLVKLVARVDERSERILALLERQSSRDDDIDRRQREDAGRGQQLSGAWNGGMRIIAIAVAVTVGLGSLLGTVAAVVTVALKIAGD